MKFFIDASGSLANVRRTSVGGLLVDATLAKVGVLQYADSRQYNTAEVLSQSLEGISTVPVTNRHPTKFVNPSNYADLAKGHVVGQATFEDGYIKATLAINDQALIEDIESGAAREVSMGYTAEMDDAPGVTDSGEPYDKVRTRLRWNHAAIVPAGRAGSTVRLMLDSEDISPEVTMVIKIAGVELSMDKVQAAVDALEASVTVLEADKGALETQVTDLSAQVAQLSSEEHKATIVADAAEKVAKAQAKAARLEKLKAAFPTVDLADKSDDYLDALELAVNNRPASDTAPLNDKSPSDAKPAKAEDAAPKLSPAEKMRLADAERWNAYRSGK